MPVRIDTVKVDFPEGTNVVLAQAHFIKTAEDVYEALVSSVPGIRFGIAFNEASGPRLVRTEGNSDALVEIAARNALNIGTGHLLVAVLDSAYPINVMHALKAVAEITTIYCATANPLKAVVLRDEESSSLIGVMDGLPPTDIEGEKERAERRDFLRKIGYKK